MKKLLLLSSIALSAAMTANAQNVYQLPNSDFEGDFVQAYKKSKTVYTEPLYWHGYASIEGSLGSMGRSGEKLNASTDVRPGSAGKQSVVITSSSVFGIVANGVMTTGRIYANSATASDADKNYNYSEPGKVDESNENQNSTFSQKFNGHPDAMRVWVKFDAASSTQTSATPYASCNAVITNNARYQDPEGSDEGGKFAAARVARAYNSEIANYGQWQQLEMPFDYSFGASDDSQYILISFTTNAQAGKGAGGDKLYIDDIEMVYNHALTSLSVNGVEKFEEGKTEFDCTDVEYEGSKIDYASDGHGATVETIYDNATGELTVNVKAEDFEVSGNMSTYKVKFKVGEQKPEKQYTENLVVTINGESLPPIPTTVTIIDNEDGTIDFLLPNFKLGDMVSVGTIRVNGVTATKEGDAAKIATKQTIFIEQGDDPEAIGPYLGEVPIDLTGVLTETNLYCKLNIEMAGLGQTIEVTLGDEATGISSAKATAKASSSEMFNIAGQKVSNAKGIVIMNGKKVIR